MKINLHELENYLERQTSFIYLVAGDEVLLKQDAIKLIRRASKNSGFNERIVINQDYDSEKIYTALYANSLLSNKRLFEFDFQSYLPNKQLAEILIDYASDPIKDNVLIFNLPKIDSKIAKTAWYQTLAKIGTTVNIWSISKSQLPQWILKRANSYSLSFEKDAAILLANHVEGNLIAANNLLKKIFLLQPKNKITKELISSIITDECHFTTFDLIDSLLMCNRNRTLVILNHLEITDVEPIMVLGSLTKEIRFLLKIAKEVAQGKNIDHLLKQYRLFSERMIAIKSFSLKNTIENYYHWLNDAAKLDKTFKGNFYHTSWQALQLFCLKMMNH